MTPLSECRIELVGGPQDGLMFIHPVAPPPTLIVDVNYYYASLSDLFEDKSLAVKTSLVYERDKLSKDQCHWLYKYIGEENAV